MCCSLEEFRNSYSGTFLVFSEHWMKNVSNEKSLHCNLLAGALFHYCTVYNIRFWVLNYILYLIIWPLELHKIKKNDMQTVKQWIWSKILQSVRVFPQVGITQSRLVTPSTEGIRWSLSWDGAISPLFGSVKTSGRFDNTRHSHCLMSEVGLEDNISFIHV